MNECPASDELCAWVQGEETPDRAARLAAHVAGCLSCAALAEEMRAVLGDLSAVAEPAGPASRPPERIGAYHVIRKIGQGGMGVVYEAEQAEPRRRVAVKVIRGAAANDEFHQRLFQREVQTLARLNHPGIAGIYDAGRTPHGEPYFVMELVEGVDLLSYAAGQRCEGRAPPLELRARLRLFVELARAMSYAHQRGVVHRDLKPGNVLVSDGETPASTARRAPPDARRPARPLARGPAPADPRPKILDFGLARVLEADADGSDRLTRTGAVFGTRDYMSPEQARGESDALDIRSDVYSLGVILYELLTGAPPYDLAARPLHEVVRIICEQPPRSPRLFNPRLPRDLATVVLHALEKEPQRRYASAGELADDLERFLTGHPVRARAAGRLYRLRRFLARNALAATLVMLLVSAILAGGGAAVVQARRIADERDQVRQEAEKVARFNAVLENLWQSIDPWRAGSREVRVLDVLGDISRRVEHEMADTPVLAAAVRNTLGNTYRSLGTLEDHRESERHLRFALETRRTQLGPDRLETAESANDLAETLYWIGEYTEAEALLREALRIRRRLRPALDPDLAETLNNLGQLLKQNQQDAAAEECYREALAIRTTLYERLQSAEHSLRERAVAAAELAETENNLGALRRAQAAALQAADPASPLTTTTARGAIGPAARPEEAAARLAEARRHYERGLELRRKWLPEIHPSLATSYNNLGRVLQDLGELAAAEEHLRAALRILEAGLGDEHQLVARALHNLAGLAEQRSRLDEAAELAQRAWRMRARLLGTEHPETRASEALAQRLADPHEPALHKPGESALPAQLESQP